MRGVSAGSGLEFSVDFCVREHINCVNERSDSWCGLCRISVISFWLPTEKYWQCHRRLWLIDVGLRGLINMPIISTFFFIFFSFLCILLMLTQCQSCRSRSAKQIKGESWLWRALTLDANSRMKQEMKRGLIRDYESRACCGFWRLQIFLYGFNVPSPSWYAWLYGLECVKHFGRYLEKGKLSLVVASLPVLMSYCIILLMFSML